MQTFKTIVDLGSFIKAAERLQYAQSTITAQIQSIEEELGAPLFNRIGKKIIVTEMAKELYCYVEEILKIYSKINNIIIDKNDIKGNLRLGASETLTIYKLGPILSEYREKYPNVTISLINDNCLRLKEKLFNGEIDLAIVLEPKVNDERLMIKKLSEEEVVFIKPLRSQAISLTEQFKDMIEKETIIFTEKDCALRRYFEGYLKENKLNYKNTIQLSNMEAIKQCVISGLGISFLPYVSVSKLIDEERIGKINSCQVLFLAQLAYLKDKWLSPAEEKFIELLERYFIK